MLIRISSGAEGPWIPVNPTAVEVTATVGIAIFKDMKWFFISQIIVLQYYANLPIITPPCHQDTDGILLITALFTVTQKEKCCMHNMHMYVIPTCTQIQKILI